MNLTVFQRLVLLALSRLLGEDSLARVLRKVAWGHHTVTQQDEILRDWWQSQDRS